MHATMKSPWRHRQVCSLARCWAGCSYTCRGALAFRLTCIDHGAGSIPFNFKNPGVPTHSQLKQDTDSRRPTKSTQHKPSNFPISFNFNAPINSPLRHQQLRSFARCWAKCSNTDRSPLAFRLKCVNQWSMAFCRHETICATLYRRVLFLPRFCLKYVSPRDYHIEPYPVDQACVAPMVQHGHVLLAPGTMQQPFCQSKLSTDPFFSKTAFNG